MKVLLGSLYSNFFAFNENVNLQCFLFFIAMIKKIKEQIKISVCTINILYSLVVGGSDRVELLCHYLNWC